MICERQNAYGNPYNLQSYRGPCLLMKHIDTNANGTEQIHQLIYSALGRYIVAGDEKIGKHNQNHSDPAECLYEYLHDIPPGI
jgi:hypothetical protein